MLQGELPSRELNRSFSTVYAVSVKKAVTPEEAGLTSKREWGWINYLVEEGKIGRTKDGKIWWKG